MEDARDVGSTAWSHMTIQRLVIAEVNTTNNFLFQSKNNKMNPFYIVTHIDRHNKSKEEKFPDRIYNDVVLVFKIKIRSIILKAM